MFLSGLFSQESWQIGLTLYPFSITHITPGQRLFPFITNPVFYHKFVCQILPNPEKFEKYLSKSPQNHPKITPKSSKFRRFRPNPRPFQTSPQGLERLRFDPSLTHLKKVFRIWQRFDNKFGTLYTLIHRSNRSRNRSQIRGFRQQKHAH
jgi:hypothetical protein